MGDTKQRNPLRFSLWEWIGIFRDATQRIGDHNLSLISAGVAFFSMLALFPAIAAMISLYGFLSDPYAVQANLVLLEPLLPKEVYKIISAQVNTLLETSSSTLGITSVISILLAIWSARTGVFAMITGLNVVYRAPTRRNFFRRVVLAYLLTFLLIAVGIVSIAAVVIVPTIIAYFPIGPLASKAIHVLRLLIALSTILLGIGILFRYGPNLKKNRVRLLSVGSVVSALLWIAGSSLFSFYLSNFGKYNEVYGSLGAVVAMLIWFYLSAWVVFLGAELNAEIAHHKEFGPDGRKEDEGDFL